MLPKVVDFEDVTLKFFILVKYEQAMSFFFDTPHKEISVPLFRSLHQAAPSFFIIIIIDTTDSDSASTPTMSTSFNCETKQSTPLSTSTNTNNVVVVFTHLLGLVNHGFSLTWFKSIFSYLGPTAIDTMKLRSYCKLFSKALKPLPCWTSFPHPKYSTLNRLFDRFNELSSRGSINIPFDLRSWDRFNKLKQRRYNLNKVSTNVPTLLFIENGVHTVESGVVNINIPISIVGESREHCIVIGGMLMKGKKEEDIYVNDLTLRESPSKGICGYFGASIHLDNVSVENSGLHGVALYGTERNSMKNCQVSYSKGSGLLMRDGGVITIEGNDTAIHHNVTGGHSLCFGLCVERWSATHFAPPLSKQTVSMNNGGGGNFWSR